MSNNNFKVLFWKDLLDSFKDKKFFVAILILLLVLYSGLSMADSINEKLVDRNIDGSIYDDLERNFGSLDLFIPFSLAIFLLPLVLLIMNFDSIAGYRQHNTIRYYILRVKRFWFLFSKVLANLLLIMIVIGLFFMISALVLHFKLGYNFNIRIFLYPWTLLTFYSLALICFYTFLSSMVRNSVLSLILCFTGLIVLTFLFSIPYMRWLSVFSYLSKFLNLSVKEKVFNYLGLIVYSVVFFFLSWLKIERSDL